ncbi:MAG: hypothetical protein SFZ03_02345 [Candidatus Melainabacteria bacterium]|nr:hypothetical protein [Candidatus Melainabacteria bacterium]
MNFGAVVAGIVSAGLSIAQGKKPEEALQQAVPFLIMALVGESSPNEVDDAYQVGQRSGYPPQTPSNVPTAIPTQTGTGDPNAVNGPGQITMPAPVSDPNAPAGVTSTQPTSPSSQPGSAPAISTAVRTTPLNLPAGPDIGSRYVTFALDLQQQIQSLGLPAEQAFRNGQLSLTPEAAYQVLLSQGFGEAASQQMIQGLQAAGQFSGGRIGTSGLMKAFMMADVIPSSGQPPQGDLMRLFNGRLDSHQAIARIAQQEGELAGMMQQFATMPLVNQVAGQIGQHARQASAA